MYNAPERSNKSDMRKADVWAIGIVLFELLSGQRLFTWRTDQQKYMQLAKLYSDNWAPPQLPVHVAGWQEVIDAMLMVDPEQRLLPSDVLKLGIFGCVPTSCTVAMCHTEERVNRLVAIALVLLASGGPGTTAAAVQQCGMGAYTKHAGRSFWAMSSFSRLARLRAWVC